MRADLGWSIAFCVEGAQVSPLRHVRLRCGSGPMWSPWRSVLVIIVAFSVTLGGALGVTQSLGQQDPSPPPMIVPPPPTTVTLRQGNEKKTIRWERFGNHELTIYIDKGEVLVNGVAVKNLPAVATRCIDYTLADCGVETDLEKFVLSASQLPLRSRYGTMRRPIRLILPAGFGVDVSDGSPCVIAVCEIAEDDRPKMFQADQQLLAYRQMVSRQEAMVQSLQDIAYAAQDAANQLRAINVAIQRHNRR